MALNVADSQLAIANHGSASDCTGQADECVPNGRFTTGFTKQGTAACRFDGSIAWGDGAVENFSYTDQISLTHQYAGHGIFTHSTNISGTPLDDESQCSGGSFSGTVEVPEPNAPVPCDARGKPSGCTFIIGSSDPVPRPVKAKARRIANQLKEANDQFELGVAAACFPASLLRGPSDLILDVLPIRVRKFVEKLASFASCESFANISIQQGRKVERLYRAIADDPPDPNFTEIAVPQLPTDVPFVRGPALSREAVQAVDPALSNQERIQERILAVGGALLTSVERSQGAELAGSAVWQLRQTLAAKRYAIQLAPALRQAVGVRQQAAQALRQVSFVLSVGEVRKLIEAFSAPEALQFVPNPQLPVADLELIRQAMLEYSVDSPLKWPDFIAQKDLLQSLTGMADSLEQWAERLGTTSK